MGRWTPVVIEGGKAEVRLSPEAERFMRAFYESGLRDLQYENFSFDHISPPSPENTGASVALPQVRIGYDIGNGTPTLDF